MTNSPFQDQALSSKALSDRKAQYAAWRDRMMNRNQDAVIDLDPPSEDSPWSTESLFAAPVGSAEE